MKRKALTLILAPLLLVLAFQVGFAAANPIGSYFPHDPHTIITVQNPENLMQFSVRTINLRFSLNLSLWYPDYLYDYNPSYSCNVSSIQYYVDGIFAGNLTEIANADESISLSVVLEGLSDGKHSLEIKTTTTGIYWHQVGGFRPGETPGWNDTTTPISDSSGLVNFTIDTRSPSISVSSPLNTKYDSSDIPLNFTVKEPTSQITYSLDGKEKSVVFGNTTLTGLGNGDHNLTIYAKDDSGNIRVSETFVFSVELHEPFPTVFVTVGTVAAVAGLLVYFKKRKH